MEEFKMGNVDVVALSVDPLDKAKETIDKLQLTFPVACGLDVPRDAEKIGAFWDERRKMMQPANFVLDSDKKVVDALIVSGRSAESRLPTPLVISGSLRNEKRSRVNQAEIWS
jgi:peroxiredoxin